MGENIFYNVVFRHCSVVYVFKVISSSTCTNLDAAEWQNSSLRGRRAFVNLVNRTTQRHHQSYLAKLRRIVSDLIRHSSFLRLSLSVRKKTFSQRSVSSFTTDLETAISRPTHNPWSNFLATSEFFLFLGILLAVFYKNLGIFYE